MTILFFVTWHSFLVSLNVFLPIPCGFYHEKQRPTHFLGLNHLEENETREKGEREDVFS